MERTQYLFIDGGYLSRIQDNAMSAVFGVQGDINFNRVREYCGSGAPIARVFYYDCIDDVRKSSESESEYMSRLALQTEFLRSIQGLDGFFVRLGSVTGRRPGKKVRQKEVDVLLAVDMLEHAYRKNMDAAVLLAGDRDFVPIIESLVRLGTYVRLHYEPTSASSELWEAADVGRPLAFDQLWGWSTDLFQAAHPLPKVRQQQGFPDLFPRTVFKRGRIGNSDVAFWTVHAGVFTAAISRDRTTISYDHADCALLERYIGIKHGQIEWSGDPVGAST